MLALRLSPHPWVCTCDKHVFIVAGHHNPHSRGGGQGHANTGQNACICVYTRISYMHRKIALHPPTNLCHTLTRVRGHRR
jgi:hypothetical protein